MSACQRALLTDLPILQTSRGRGLELHLRLVFGDRVNGGSSQFQWPRRRVCWWWKRRGQKAPIWWRFFIYWQINTIKSSGIKANQAYHRSKTREYPRFTFLWSMETTMVLIIQLGCRLSHNKSSQRADVLGPTELGCGKSWGSQPTKRTHSYTLIHTICRSRSRYIYIYNIYIYTYIYIYI